MSIKGYFKTTLPGRILFLSMKKNFIKKGRKNEEKGRQLKKDLLKEEKGLQFTSARTKGKQTKIQRNLTEEATRNKK